ncbi:MAG TPA: phage protease [Verrucomicrobiae bacterium]
MNNTFPIEARLAAALPTLPSANGEKELGQSQLGSAGVTELPTEIQWMPPGQHVIAATQGEAPVTQLVIVNAETAVRMEALLQELRAQAEAGAEDVPYFDFNHEDAEASARPLRFYWGGEDAITGGVRVEVEWTEPGRTALLGKAYRRFSPSFFVDVAGEVTGAPLNMGGLVNRAAFKTINPIVAGASDSDANQERSNIMDPMKLAAELAAAQKRILELEQQLTLKAKEQARAIVDTAIRTGKLAPQNTALHAKWVDALTKNPELSETLTGLATNQALISIVPHTMAPVHAAHSNGPEHEFVVKARQFAEQRKVVFTEAVMHVAAKEPELYEAYRTTLGE